MILSKLFKSFSPNFYKGKCFFYTFRKKHYGAVVVEEQYGPMKDCKYILVALTDELLSKQLSLDGIMAATVYTMAWFSAEDMPFYLHFIGDINISRCFYNKYGMEIVAGKSITCTNCGQSSVWKHKFRTLNFKEQCISDLIN